MASKRKDQKEEEEVEAKSAMVTADSITEPEKIRMTGVHHGSRSEARGDVEIEIKSQYPNTGGTDKRLPVGTVIKTDRATIQARKILHHGRRGGKDKITARDNVGIFGRFRRKS